MMTMAPSRSTSSPPISRLRRSRKLQQDSFSYIEGYSLTQSSNSTSPTLINETAYPHSSATSSIVYIDRLDTPLTFTASNLALLPTPDPSDDDSNNNHIEELTVEELEILSKMYGCAATFPSESPFLEAHGLMGVIPLSLDIPVDEREHQGVKKQTNRKDVNNKMRRHIAPLSNLPTPPEMGMSIEIPLLSCLPGVTIKDLENPELIGRAKYLKDFVPLNAGLEPPRASVILGVLVRAETYMAMEVIGLAGCILDSLSSNFATQWRSTFYKSFGYHGRSELLAIVALIIAVKFLNDRAPANSYWSEYILDRHFSIWALNTTERLMLQDNDYCINYLASPKLIAQAVRRIRVVIEEHKSKYSRLLQINTATAMQSPPTPTHEHDDNPFGPRSSSLMNTVSPTTSTTTATTTSTSSPVTSDLASIFTFSDADHDADMFTDDDDYYSDSEYSLDEYDEFDDETKELVTMSMLKAAPAPATTVTPLSSSSNLFKTLITKEGKQRTPEFEVVPHHLSHPIYPVSAGIYSTGSLRLLPSEAASGAAVVAREVC